MIPFFGVARQYANLREQILDTTDRVLTTGQMLDGPYVEEFEAAMARRCDRQFAIAVNSCTQALVMALGPISRPAGDHNVLIPALGFAATVNSVVMTKSVPVFCDVDRNGLMDLESMDSTMTSGGIRTIMYSNLFGNTVDYDRFQVISQFFNNSDVVIIEDAAQSFGARYQGIPSGKLGHISALSFDPTKNLNNYGSGGMLLTDDHSLAMMFKRLRNNGRWGEYCGTNSRMSESDCAQMLVKLQHFDAWQERRQEIAEYYLGELDGYVDLLPPNVGVDHAWSKFVIRSSERQQILEALDDAGVETRIHYDVPLSELQLSRSYATVSPTDFCEAQAFSIECLSLPIYPELADSEVEVIVTTIQRCLR